LITHGDKKLGKKRWPRREKVKERWKRKKSYGRGKKVRKRG
jgi:hypothetical protein